MAVSDRLFDRLSRVPGVELADIDLWVAESADESGLTELENENAILYLALAIAYENIAANSAHFFKYTDGDESIDKTAIYSNYMELSKNARRNYRKYVRGRGASQTNVGRADER